MRPAVFAGAALAIALGCSHHASETGGDGDAATGGHGDAATGSGGGRDASATGDAGSGSASSICGTRTDRRGKTSRTIEAAGLSRTYIVYLPTAIDPATPIPLVYVFHGYTMSGENMYDITGYPALADADQVALAFPDGQGGPNSALAPWNVGSNVCPADGIPPPDATGDDFAFIDAMRADIEEDQCIDAAHVFVSGFSMGGYFAHHAGCERPDLAAVAPHSGGTHDLSACPSAKKPIIIFHGTADPVVPEACDDPAGTPIAGHEASATAWAAHNGCAATFTTQTVDNGTCDVYDGCPAGGQVELCTLTNMGHCWAGGGSGSIYACPGYASATDLQWQFFKTYAW